MVLPSSFLFNAASFERQMSSPPGPGLLTPVLSLSCVYFFNAADCLRYASPAGSTSPRRLPSSACSVVSLVSLVSRLRPEKVLADCARNERQLQSSLAGSEPRSAFLETLAKSALLRFQIELAGSGPSATRHVFDFHPKSECRLHLDQITQRPLHRAGTSEPRVFFVCQILKTLHSMHADISCNQLTSIRSSASPIASACCGRTRRASSMPSFRKTSVGQSLTRKERPRGLPFPSSILK